MSTEGLCYLTRNALATKVLACVIRAPDVPRAASTALVGEGRVGRPVDLIVIASCIPPRPYSAEAYHAEVACVGEPVLHRGAFNGGWDEACMIVIGMMLTSHGRDMAGWCSDDGKSCSW